MLIEFSIHRDWYYICQPEILKFPVIRDVCKISHILYGYHEKWSILYSLHICGSFPFYFQDVLDTCFLKCPWTSSTSVSQKLVRNADSHTHTLEPVWLKKIFMRLLSSCMISSEGSTHVNSFTGCRLAQVPHYMVFPQATLWHGS